MDPRHDGDASLEQLEAEHDALPATVVQLTRVSPRRGELVDAGLVAKAGDKRGATGRKVSWWKPAAVQLDLFSGIPPS